MLLFGSWNLVIKKLRGWNRKYENNLCIDNKAEATQPAHAVCMHTKG